ncbi:hypothetical protein AOQ84DRAFT_212662 [Glonium stellatum]|uniref:Uncharacterized protein n=1 Tax=Glonium stellatum TaxID=574774 RepID=A0A8E2F599_9PEZI|nr:hypothetical protein AOQ84DRAFT_212662 [Glonium stellatum]
MCYIGVRPISKAPGSQDLYIDGDGAILITVQNSRFVPPGTYWGTRAGPGRRSY